MAVKKSQSKSPSMKSIEIAGDFFFIINLFAFFTAQTEMS